MKLTYVLEVEVPGETPALEYQAFLNALKQALRWNAEKGWKAKLREVQPTGCMSGHGEG